MFQPYLVIIRLTHIYYSIIWTNKMHYFLLIYFNNKPLHVSSRLAAHHQEDQLCINSNWYNHGLCWLAAGNTLYPAWEMCDNKEHLRVTIMKLHAFYISRDNYNSPAAHNIIVMSCEEIKFPWIGVCCYSRVEWYGRVMITYQRQSTLSEVNIKMFVVAQVVKDFSTT
jgi:hypothetical protein